MMARLLLVNLAEVNSLRDGFLVVNLRLTLVTFNLEFTFQTVDNDIQVKLTHTGDNCLTSLLVGTNGEGRVFFSQLGQTVGQPWPDRWTACPYPSESWAQQRYR